MKLYKFFDKEFGTYLALIKRLHEVKEDAVIVWSSKPTIGIGINEDHEKFKANNKRNIDIYRVPMKGGALYLDGDVINFNVLYKTNNFTEFHTRELLNKLLNQLGVETELNDRNDILYGGKKVSGGSKKVGVDNDYLWVVNALSFNIDHDSAEEVFRFTKHGGIRERASGLWQMGVKVSKEEVIEEFERAIEKHFDVKLELQPEPEEVKIKQRDKFLKEGKYSK
jgi:lipoate-protein ligase A